MRLTRLLGRVFDEQRGDVLVHARLVLGDAGVGAGVLVAHAADQQLAAVRCGRTKGRTRRSAGHFLCTQRQCSEGHSILISGAD